VKTVETVFNEQTWAYENTTKLYVRSSALGGQVIIEMDEQGNKLSTYVYAGGGVLARQIKGVAPYTNDYVSFEHRDPSNASLRTTYTDGNILTQEEYDPVGADANLGPTLISEPPPDEGGGGSLLDYGEGGMPSFLRTTYILDGMAVDADFALQALNSGAAAQCPNNDCGPRWNGRGYSLWNPSTGWSAIGPQGGQPPTLQSHSARPAGVGPGNRNPFGVGDEGADDYIPYDLLPHLAPGEPQNPGQQQGGIQGGATATPADPCRGVSASDLDYSQRRRYGRGQRALVQTAEEHIRMRHLNPSSGASQYTTDPPVSQDVLFQQVRGYNAATFTTPDMRRPLQDSRGNITGYVFVKTFPPIVPHPIYENSGAGWIGIDVQTGGTTLTNTLFLGPDCRTVQTSHPGFPSLPGFGPNPDNP
jgi:hypothetical protein